VARARATTGRPVTLSASDRARLDQAVKSDDSPYTTFAISPWSKYLAWEAGRLGLTPNQVTLTSVAVATLAAAAFAAGARPGYVLGALLLQLSFGLDCADGQLARLTSSFSQLGGWLDAMCDRLKEYVVYAGLAVGSLRAGDDVWLLAVLALVLQTVRHAVDTAWSVTPAAVSAGTEGAARAATGQRRRWHWARKVAILPIGERWLLVSVLAAFTRPRVVFVVLLAAGVLAAAYMVAARLRRSLRPPPAATAPEAAAQLDRLRNAGPLAALLARVGPDRPAAAVVLPVLGAVLLAAALVESIAAGSGVPLLLGALALVLLAALGGRRPPDPRWGWTVPPLLRSGEYATAVVAGWISATSMSLPYVYLLVAVWLDYDSAYRIRHRLPGNGGWGEPSPTVDVPGFEVRLLAVAALATAGGAVFGTGMAVLVAVLLVLAIVRGARLWRRSNGNDLDADGRGAYG
jgi:phosphatidylglycerophosphate synthase